jgi:hypothetical protein
MTKCPNCQKPGGALNADKHCTSQTCTWNKCKCGTTYDRTTGNGFSADKHYPAAEQGAA